MCCSAIGNGVQNVMTNVANFVRTLPSPGNVHRHVVVVTFILRRHQTNIQVEIQELENGVRATGLLCLLGISVGLGSIFVYRLYTRLFNSVPAKRKHRVSELGSTKSSTLSEQNTPLITPDSGIVADGPAGKLPVPSEDTKCVDEPIHSPGQIRRCFSEFANLNGLHQRLSHSGSIEDILQVDLETHKQHLRRTWAVQNWLANVDTAAAASVSADSVSDVIPDPKDMVNSFGSRWSSADHGFVSGWMTESAEFLQEVSPPRQVHAPDVCQAPSLTSVSAITKEDGGCGRAVGALFGDQVQLFNMNSSLVRDPYPSRKRHNSVSRVDDSRRWRRRRFSVASSVLSSEYEYRESLVSKGFSVDLGEDLEGMMTPPSEMDLTKHSGSMLTVDGMESLHLALRQIQRDIDDMNKKFDGLRSSAVLDPIGSCAELAESEEQCPNAVNFSCGNSENGDEESCSGRQELDFMWDYRSDLVTSGRGHRFVARRPVVAPSPAEYLRHLRLGLPRNFSDVGTEYSIGGAIDEGMQDMYIDDELLGTIASGLPSDFPSLPAVGQRVGYKRSCDAMSDQSRSGSECSSNHSKRSSHRSFHHAACRHGYVSDSESPNHSCSSSSRHAGGYSCNHSDSCCFGAHNHCGGSCDGRRSSQSNHTCSHHHSHSNPANEHGAAPCHGHHRNCSSTSHCGCTDQCHVLSARHTCAHACDHCNNVRPACLPDGQRRLVHLAMENFDSRDHCNNVSTVAAEETPSPTTFGRCVGDKLDVVKASDAMVLASQVAHKSCVDLLRLWNVSHVRSMLGDKNCMIRTVLYAALLNNQPILSRCGNLNECSQKLSCYADTRHKYLCCWNVMELNSNVDRSVTDKLVDCLKVLYEQVEIIGRLSTVSQRDQYLSALLNGSQEIDRQMMEAVKVLVMLDLIGAYEDFVSGATNSGPFVVWQILSRDTSLTAEMFFHNYLNNVRDGITLFTEQLELSFLAHTLGLRLQVFQPSHAGHSDALRHYPDEGADHLSLVRIIRCDDPARYYIPVGC